MGPTNPPELRSFVRIWRNFPDSWFDKGMKTEIRRLTSAEYLLATPALVDLYIAAMDYPVNVRAQRISSWRQEALSPGFTAIAAVADDTIIGIAYGMLGQRERWWDQQLRRALAMQGGPSKSEKELLQSYFEVAEIHVLPSYQGRGIGARLLRELLRLAPAKFALLSTPEVEHEDNGAFKLYRKFGFSDVARNYLYPADPRPFAILGRSLPLSASPML